MPSVFIALAVTAFIITILSALGKVPLWIAVLLITILLMLQALPR